MSLTARDLTFAYNSRPVLDRVSLRLRPGRLTGLIGPNGSGKSTLLRCLDRILKPRQGSLLIEGQELDGLTSRELARRIAYVPQSGAPLTAATVAEAVLLGRRPHLGFRVSGPDRAKADEALAALGLTGLADRYFDELSGGEKQKVLLARALAQETPVLLLDEPTSNLDLRHQLEVLDLLTGLARSRNLCLAVTLHDLNLAARYGDELVLLDQGQVAADGSPAEVLTPDNLARVYGVRTQVEPGHLGRPRITVLGPVGPGDKGEGWQRG